MMIFMGSPRSPSAGLSYRRPEVDGYAIARCLERVADHCKNIAEEVYYLYHAVDIRHERAP